MENVPELKTSTHRLTSLNSSLKHYHKSQIRAHLKAHSFHWGASKVSYLCCTTYYIVWLKTISHTTSNKNPHLSRLLTSQVVPCDHGTEFGRQVEGVADEFGGHLVKSSPGMPHSLGQDERSYVYSNFGVNISIYVFEAYTPNDVAMYLTFSLTWLTIQPDWWWLVNESVI